MHKIGNGRVHDRTAVRSLELIRAGEILELGVAPGAHERGDRAREDLAREHGGLGENLDLVVDGVLEALGESVHVGGAVDEGEGLPGVLSGLNSGRGHYAG